MLLEGEGADSEGVASRTAVAAQKAFNQDIPRALGF